MTPPVGLNSVLTLRLEAPGVEAAALVLGHTRSWSFPATPLSRVRALGNLALRLLLAGESPTPSEQHNHSAELMGEVARLRTQIASLQAEIGDLRADKTKKRSGKPR
jgi:uncharacterized small protein (DUF1192 family)